MMQGATLCSKTCSRGNRARSFTQFALSLTTTSFVHFKSDTVELRDAQSSTPNKWYVKPITTQELCPVASMCTQSCHGGKWSSSPVSHSMRHSEVGMQQTQVHDLHQQMVLWQVHVVQSNACSLWHLDKDNRSKSQVKPFNALQKWRIRGHNP